LVGWTTETFLDIPEAQALVWISLAIGMVYGLRAAIEAIRQLSVDIDVLMVVGAALAAGVGHPEEGALLLCLFVLSGALEARALERTRREVEALHKLMPRVARVLRAGEWHEIDPHDLVRGDRIRLRPGDVIPVDCELVEGASAVDQSTLTGESMPREVHPGDELFAGTVNTSSAIEATVLRPAAESSLQKILNLVIEAREQRQPVQRAIDRLSRPYAISVLLASLLVVLIWWLAFAEPFSSAAYTAITFLIVMSPCALIIATPTVTLSAIARAARAGVLFKGGHAIERLSQVAAVCFDKTGTLTHGKPRIMQVHPVAWSSGPDLLSVAAGLEADSTHPIATAIRDAAKRKGVGACNVQNVQHIPGRGLTGSLHGAEVRLGNIAHTEEHIPTCLRARVREVLDRIQSRGQIGVVVALAGSDAEAGQAAVLVISDPLRENAADMVASLHELGVRHVRMFTGDNTATAAHVAKTVGISEWNAELFPEDKLRLVREMRDHAREHHHVRRCAVAYIGDGVNDAPALSAADVGLAIGSIGSDAALESADIVLLADDLRAVPWALELARRARAILVFNIIFALTVIVGMAAATLIGSRAGWPVPMSIGVIAHEGGTLFVVVNALRLLGARGYQRSAAPRAAAPKQTPIESPELEESLSAA
ncbi:MAG: cation-translocating P-type ATPase, partial [Planctomycetota bacterium]|nr:cation-translocating P-type ATPase [Planctomycetota bacterium]